jgi:hypothetical protein
LLDLLGGLRSVRKAHNRTRGEFSIKPFRFLNNNGLLLLDVLSMDQVLASTS